MKKYKVIGLMSGTSLDGLDLAYCQFWKEEGKWNYKIKQTKVINYNIKMKLALKNTIHLKAQDLLRFNNEYGKWLAEQVKIFIDEFNLKVDFISSHGHTVHHQPEKGLTYQIGSGQYLANISGYTVVCDFRTNDVALGGQGAPLVPIGDKLLFNSYAFCLNIGGISDISFEKESERVAYDIGVANMLLNYITQKINLPFDKGGELAKKGKINLPMLHELNNLPYYKLPFPKSTGYEWFATEILPIVKKTKDSIENLLHTSVYHIAEQIAIEILKNNSTKFSSVLVTGGGALNNFLIEVLQFKLGEEIRLEITSKKLIEFKEALIFAFLGVLRIRKEVNILSSVTGAKKDSSSGVVFFPN